MKSFVGRVSNLRVYAGDLGWVTNYPFQEKAKKDPFPNSLPQCIDGVNYQYLMYKDGVLVENSLRECVVCGASNQIPTNVSQMSTIKYLPMVWSRNYCTVACSVWEKTDRKTGSCYTPYPTDNFNIAGSDAYVCGDSFLEEKFTEQCEFYTAGGSDSSCSKTCKPNQAGQVICRADVFGKSACEICSLELCNKNRWSDFYLKKCLSDCGFKYDSGEFVKSNSTSGQASTVAGGVVVSEDKAYYIDNTTLEQKICDPVELNIVLRMNDPALAYQNCKICANSGYFYQDSSVQFCFESDRNPKRKYIASSKLITESIIDIMGYVIGSAAIFMIIMIPCILGPMQSISIFFRYWEIMQYFYMVSFTIQKNFMTQQLFRKFSFVSFEIFGYKGTVLKWIFNSLLPKNGLIIVDMTFRSLQSQTQYNEYKSPYNKYFELGKTGLFLFDAAAMLESFIYLFLFILIFSIILSVLSRGSNGKGPKTRDKMARMNRGLIPSVLTWYFMENLPLLLFFALGQYYLLPARVGAISNTVIMTNKIIMYLFLVFALAMMPIYIIGVAVKFFKDDSMLERIRQIGFVKAGTGMRLYFLLSMFRKVVFTLYFIPAVNYNGYTIYLFIVVLTEIIEIVVLTFSTVFKRSLVNLIQMFSAFIVGSLAFVLMVEKLVSGIYAMSKSDSSNQRAIETFFYIREWMFFIGTISTVAVFVIATIILAIRARQELLTNQMSEEEEMIELTKNNDDSKKAFAKYLEDDFLDKRNFDLAAL